ncbi:gp20 [Mycobacterium phage Barnyard]|uniref:Uncharacterized protein n=1 Tax=Mycobacterium phage Barnyard TaxID=205880 RepID=Q856F2_9CAUD|nr:gp20 [Mycobacterium phage Barnyard]AAN02074.1 minor capsid protein [Mycobacterium phage Barnyard]
MSFPNLTTKPRWDKYDGYVGNFRAPLAAAVNLATQANRVLPVGINAQGAAVLGGAGQTGIVGVVIIPVGTDMNGNLLDGGINTGVGDICDVGKHGEIVNFKTTAADGTQGAPAAGTNYYAHPNGAVDATKGADGVYIGHTVEADRLIVNVNEKDAAA